MPRPSYEQRLHAFAKGRDLVTVPLPGGPDWPEGPLSCDACGSNKLVVQCGLWDRATGDLFIVGQNCRDALLILGLATSQEQWARSLPEYTDMLPGDKSWEPRERAWAIVRSQLPTAEALMSAYNRRKEATSALEDQG